MPWNFRQFFIDGKRMNRARYPNIDEANPYGEIDKGNWLCIEGVKGELDTEGEWYLDHCSGIMLR